MWSRLASIQPLSPCRSWKLHEAFSARAVTALNPFHCPAERLPVHSHSRAIAHRSVAYSTKSYIPSSHSNAAVQKLPHGPLRILFCGSDIFSAVSLRALLERKESAVDLIQSIDVLYRPAKRTGQGLKTFTFPPIHDVCKTLPGVRNVHHIDSFKSWDTYIHRPHDINLLIAVSFGLLIPAKLIEGAAYGGLNVHPSLLPDLPGAAPVHRALLNRRTHTGVTVQTLHPTKFDAGIRLAQTPLPGIPVPKDATTDDLTSTLAAEGSKLLLETICSRLFIEPRAHRLPDFSEDQVNQVTDGRGLAKAPKVDKIDSKISWTSDSAQEILLKLRVFGRVWSELGVDQIQTLLGYATQNRSFGSPSVEMGKNGRPRDSHFVPDKPSTSPPTTTRMLYEDIVEMNMSDPRSSDLWKDATDPTQNGNTIRTQETRRDYSLGEGFPVWCADGTALLVRRCTMSGGKRGAGLKDLRKMAAWLERRTVQ